jgi:TPP-dependent pyruvate/acetoin dehydrogenase alpha subunit
MQPEEVIMAYDPWRLYSLMLGSRLFEEATARLWHDGLISGELHLGTGEEAVIVGVVAQLEDGDSMALDHRGTAALLVRGVDPVAILRELLGRPDGLCGGMGGHMHLFSPDHLAASSGIVGAAGPCAAGFALAAQHLRPGAVTVAFFGDGAMNQGMLMESLNLASIWSLPVLFVCKDDGWSITTESGQVTGGDPVERARGLGVPAVDVDGRDVGAVWEAAAAAIERARSGQGPTFLRSRCVHFEGHFLGYQLLRMVRQPLKEMPGVAAPLARSLLRPGGAALRERVAAVRQVLGSVLSTLRDPRRDWENDPMQVTRKTLAAETEGSERLRSLEEDVRRDLQGTLERALGEEAS